MCVHLPLVMNECDPNLTPGGQLMKIDAQGVDLRLFKATPKEHLARVQA